MMRQKVEKCNAEVNDLSRSPEVRSKLVPLLKVLLWYVDYMLKVSCFYHKMHNSFHI